MKKRITYALPDYKHTTCIPRLNDGRFHVISTWNTGGVFVPRGSFRTLSNIYDGFFWQKLVTTKYVLRCAI